MLLAMPRTLLLPLLALLLAGCVEVDEALVLDGKGGGTLVLGLYLLCHDVGHTAHEDAWIATSGEQLLHNGVAFCVSHQTRAAVLVRLARVDDGVGLQPVVLRLFGLRDTALEQPRLPAFFQLGDDVGQVQGMQVAAADEHRVVPHEDEFTVRLPDRAERTVLLVHLLEAPHLHTNHQGMAEHDGVEVTREVVEQIRIRGFHVEFGGADRQIELREALQDSQDAQRAGRRSSHVALHAEDVDGRALPKEVLDAFLMLQDLLVVNEGRKDRREHKNKNKKIK